MSHFDHEKLEVYQASVNLVILINTVITNLPKGMGYLSDQFQRAALSVPLNIAEGGEYSINEKRRFYRMAKRSATECAGIFDICFRLRIVEDEYHDKGRELLLRIVAMLTKLAKDSK